MKRRLWKMPAGLVALGLVLFLSGCPINVDTRSTDMGGPGDLFNQTATITAPVTITIAGFDATFIGSLPGYPNREIMIYFVGRPYSITMDAADVSDRNQLTVHFPDVVFPANAVQVGFFVPVAGGNPAVLYLTEPLQLSAGLNTVSWGSFNP